ncbi:MAG: signal peptide peptidase SppA [Chloroflexota bacterium]|nr:signal peptide peptidase SppA [Chloroflexota bacterium]
MKQRRWPWFLLGMAATLVLMGSCLGGAAVLRLLTDGGLMGLGEGVAVIPVEGTIVSGEPPSGLTRPPNVYSAEIVRFIRQAEANSAVKAIVVRVDSPGGGVVASDEICQALHKVGKPVVISMGSVAASGGYYISCAADEIFANPNTLTGSIGVISIVPNLQGLLDKIGVKIYVMESGPHKEGGTFQPFTEEERKIWEGIIEETYSNFVQVVVEGRGLSEKRVRELADGRVYTGEQALKAGLVDSLGNLPEAVARAGELGDIVGKPRIIHYRPAPSLLGGLLGSFLPANPPAAWRELLQQPFTVQYLYLRP